MENEMKEPSARKRKTPRSVDAQDLGISHYGELNASERELLIGLAKTHPRQFWEMANRKLDGRLRDDERSLVRGFELHPTLLRAGLAKVSKSAGTDGVGRNAALAILLGASLRLRGKSPAYHQARVAAAQKSLSQVSASEVFHLLCEPAIAGNAQACLALAKLMPDAKSADRSEARRFTFGETSFAQSGLHNEERKAQTRAFIHAQAQGLGGKPLAPGEWCRNAFYLIAHRHRETLLAGRPEAAIWGEAALILARRCPDLSQSSECLALMLGSDLLRQDLRDRCAQCPQGRYVWHRQAFWLEAFQLARPEAVKEMIDYMSTTPAKLAPGEPQGAPSRFVDGPPIWAVALLAGHAPDPAWMPKPGSNEASAIFHMPKALSRAAQDGTLSPRDLSSRDFNQTGAAHDAAILCKALGHAPRAKTAKKAKPA